jgi:hypothetical protein
MLLGVSIYAVILNRVGYLVSTFLLMLFLFKGIEPHGWTTAIIATIITTACSYILFGVWLGTQFP